MSEKQVLIKEKFYSKGFFAVVSIKLFALLFISLVFLVGCQKREKKFFPPPKPLLVRFELEKFDFYGENLPDETAQTRTVREMAVQLQSFYNSLFFNPDNFNKEVFSQIAAEFLNPLALEKLQTEKIAVKSLFKLKPYLRKILSGEGRLKNFAVYLNKDTNDFIGVAEVEVKAVYLLEDGKKLELNHNGELVLKGQMGGLKIEEFKFKEKVRTYGKPEKKE